MLDSTETIDVQVIFDGSIVLFDPRTPEADNWFEHNIDTENAQYLGYCLAVEHRYAGDIIEGLARDGLRLAA